MITLCALLTTVLAVLSGCSSPKDAPLSQAQKDANAKAAMKYVDPMAGYKPQVVMPGAGSPAPQPAHSASAPAGQH
jgi:hypothetical protein